MHTPPDMSLWQGRDDTAVEGPDALRIHQCIKPWTPESPPGVSLIGFACDEGVRRNQGRVGAAEGPKALRKALANLAWDETHVIYDAGDVCCDDGDLETAQENLGRRVATLIELGHRPILLGGGHETAWGNFLGLTAARPEANIGVINVDAHFDLRDSPVPHSGTSFRQIADWHRRHDRPFRCLCLGIAEESNTLAAFRAAETLGVQWESDVSAAWWQTRLELDQECGGRGDRLFDMADAIYLSVDLDVLPGAVMPACSAPAGMGMSLGVLESLIKTIVSSGRVALADVVEFNPRYDRDGTAAKTAARVVWTLARCWWKKSQGLEP